MGCIIYKTQPTESTRRPGKMQQWVGLVDPRGGCDKRRGSIAGRGLYNHNGSRTPDLEDV
ncbi:predicted protein [Pyrenophora tritici-repentis Pt-1C-BFP]|uniref:Uncharacterized protein n=1 Tax=Pyrenophora tritici-repentis (strain Pt-1C-BFP) TaxID=426418 RepID=B2WA75_PYRTR|nr:uncharacterized protein PTRG_07188 [Pyrenophora tritici-repentis Pt-1C-BFP]EDU50107.1 predicted protein [Pyrenophora tritici-repentis Pt-1C-BFP]